MKKQSGIALFLASACIASSAYAQSSVTLYGIVDNAVEY